MDEDWKKKKNRSSRPSVDDWQGLHHISWINNGGEKKSLKKTHVQFSSFPLKTNCQNRTKVIKKTNKKTTTSKNTETVLVQECSAQINIWPQQGTAFFSRAKTKLDSLEVWWEKLASSAQNWLKVKTRTQANS